MMKLVTGLLVVGLAAMVVFQCGCDENGAAGRGREQPAGDLAKKPAGNPVVVVETSEGTIRIELDAEKAPISVKNFLQYVDQGFYDGTIFHRVMDGFMIQGGGFTPDMQQKPTHATIKNEAQNGLENRIGTVAMARTPDPHSASAQFFINVKDNDFLNHTAPTARGWGYCVFGKVVDGMEVVNRIKTVRTGTVAGMENVPVTPVVIKTVRRATGG